MGVHIREIYPGKWYLRITYKNIRKTKAAGSKERAIDLKKKLTKEGFFSEIKERRFYDKPSVQKKKKQAKAAKRRRKRMRKFS